MLTIAQLKALIKGEKISEEFNFLSNLFFELEPFEWGGAIG